jgi:phospholipid/cholesterol/gamma-HCH transport system substrate-binding protein
VSPHPLKRIRQVADRRRATVITLGLAAVAAAAGATWFTAQPGTYMVRAVFPSAQSLFSGAAVQLLGVRIGTVTNVQYENGAVDVTMQVNGSQSLPRDVHAALEAPLLLGTPNIDLSPGYTGGPTLTSGSVIPESRTSVPVSTDELLHQMERVLGAVKPQSAKQLVDNLATDIAGQGNEINDLIKGASGTLQLLAAKGTELGQMNGSLAQLTSTLDRHESRLLDLIKAYDTVSQVIAVHQSALAGAIDELSKASAQLASLLSPNTKPIEQDVAVITTLGRTLDRNLANLDQVMSASRKLFAGAHNSFDPLHKWINLNNQLAPGLTTDVLEGLVRDRLAGICRRVLAHHSAGLSAAQKKSLAECGNQYSGYFNPILKLIPKILKGESLPGSALSGSSGSSGSLGSVIGAGLSKIPGLSQAERHAIAKAATSSVPTTPQPASGTTAKKKTCGKGIDGAVDCVLGPLPPIGSGSGSSSGSGGGGLLGSIETFWGWSW